MSSVHLHVRSTDGTSKTFTLAEHDTFLLGRMDDCHLCVPGCKCRKMRKGSDSKVVKGLIRRRILS